MTWYCPLWLCVSPTLIYDSESERIKEEPKCSWDEKKKSRSEWFGLKPRERSKRWRLMIIIVVTGIARLSLSEKKRDDVTRLHVCSIYAEQAKYTVRIIGSHSLPRMWSIYTAPIRRLMVASGHVGFFLHPWYFERNLPQQIQHLYHRPCPCSSYPVHWPS
jgi:hypothetical protein